MANETTGRFQKWLATLPSTSLQLVVGLSLAAFAVVVVLAAVVVHSALGHGFGPLQEGPIDSTYLFIAGILSVGGISFGVKRFTTKPEIIAAQAAAAGQSMSVQTETTTTSTQAGGAPVAPGGVQ